MPYGANRPCKRRGVLHVGTFFAGATGLVRACRARFVQLCYLASRAFIDHCTLCHRRLPKFNRSGAPDLSESSCFSGGTAVRVPTSSQLRVKDLQLNSTDRQTHLRYLQLNAQFFERRHWVRHLNDGPGPDCASPCLLLPTS